MNERGVWLSKPRRVATPPIPPPMRATRRGAAEGVVVDDCAILKSVFLPDRIQQWYLDFESALVRETEKLQSIEH